MLRILFIALIIYVIWRLWKKASRAATARPDAPSASGQIDAGEMIACARCGTFVLKSESILSGGNRYCSEQCREKFN